MVKNLKKEMRWVRKTLLGALAAIALTFSPKGVGADFLIGLRIPKEYSYQFDYRVETSSKGTTYKAVPKYFGKRAWGFLSLSSLNGRLNDSSVGVGSILNNPLPILPTLEARISHSSCAVQPFFGLAATCLLKDGLFEIDPALRYDIKGNSLFYGITIGTKLRDSLRFGMKVYGKNGDKPTLRGLYRTSFDASKFFEAHLDAYSSGFRVVANF